MTNDTNFEVPVVLPIIAAALATVGTLSAVWSHEPDWSNAAVNACIATGFWSTVILERAKRRARIGQRQTQDASDNGAVSAKFLTRFYTGFALAYTVLTMIWAFAVGLMWVILAAVSAFYWYHSHRNWLKTRPPSQQNG